MVQILCFSQALGRSIKEKGALVSYSALASESGVRVLVLRVLSVGYTLLEIQRQTAANNICTFVEHAFLKRVYNL